MDQVGISGGGYLTLEGKGLAGRWAFPLFCASCLLRARPLGGHGRTTLELAKLVVQVRFLSDCRCRWAIKGVPGDTQH